MEMRCVLRVEGLSYTYSRDLVALRDVEFEVYSGEVVTVLGPNGAGKTTLLKCILRLLKPRGVVYIDGKRRWDELSSRELAKYFGYVPQTHHSVFAYRVLDFILMGRAPHHTMFSLPSRRDYEKVHEVAKLLGIEDLLERSITELSGGQMQLVLIARALVQEAKVLLLDEPTAHLDIVNSVRVLSVVRRLVKSGRVDAAIMAMHDPVLAASFSDKVLLMSRGRVVAYGSPQDVLRPEVLREVYGVDFVRFEHCGFVVVVPRAGTEV